jgi:hypothetical protein
MPPNWLLKNSADVPSGTFTFAFVSFVVVTFCVLMSTVSTVTFGQVTISLKPVDSTLALGYLAATFSSYVVRRTTTPMVEATPKQ